MTCDFISNFLLVAFITAITPSSSKLVLHVRNRVNEYCRTMYLSRNYCRVVSHVATAAGIKSDSPSFSSFLMCMHS
uniref:Putative secreted protein n=1 Tax=Rhipicephalus microplus TaxID=6941 RepID=A0A6G5A1Y5_RHIMP